MESLVGVRLADSAERAASRRAKIAAFADRVPIVDFGREIAERWADLFAVSERAVSSSRPTISPSLRRRQLGFGVVVGPSDEAHFRRVPNLHVQPLRA